MRVIAISADYPDEIQTKILPFLKQFKLNFPVYVQDFPKPDQFIDTMNSKWNGALPATFIYDKSGQQKNFLIGKRSLKEFKQLIDETLESNKSQIMGDPIGVGH